MHAMTITVRNVPDKVRDELAARAAQSGHSLQEFLLQHLIEMASRPSAAEVLARARARARTTGTQLNVGEILAARDADRR
jgi:antitoxin FitA